MRYLEQAVNLDPGFARAWAELSEAHSRIWHFGFDRSQDRMLKAKSAAEEALRLEPELSEGHAALGYYHYYIHRNYGEALKEFGIAEKKLPSVVGGIAAINRRQGHFVDALNGFRKAVELDPRSSVLALEIAMTYTTTRNFEKAEQYFDKSISLDPVGPHNHIMKAWNYCVWNGATEKARVTLDKVSERGKFPFAVWVAFLLELYGRNYEGALKELSSSSIDLLSGQLLVTPRKLMEGMLYRLMNRPQEARKSFEAARITLEKELNKQPDDHRIHSSLGTVYAGLGRNEQAVREGKLGKELFPISKDAYIGPQRIEDMAQIYVMVGRQDAAIEELEHLASLQSLWFSPILLRIDPRWDPLRSHPRFQKLLEKYDHGDTKAGS